MSNGSVLITGGSGGIGSAAAALFAQRSYRPVIGYAHDRERADEIAKQTHGISVQLDLSDPASVDHAITVMEQSAPDLIGVVLAGSPPPTLLPFGKIESSDLDAHLAVHVSGTHRLLSALVRGFFRAKKEGFVVGVLSAAMGLGTGRANASLGAYVIGKYGLAGVLALAQQDYPWLRVATVSPSYTDTDMLNVFDARYVEQLRQRGDVETPAAVAATIVDAALGKEANS